MAIPKENYYVAKTLTPGKVARENPINYIRSFAAGISGIGFGRAVQISSVDPELVVLANSNSLVLAGVAMESVDTHNTDYTTETYLTGAAVGVMDQGNVIVSVEEAISIGDAVRVRITANGVKVPGSFAKTSDGGKTLLLSPTCAQWRSPSASGIGITGLQAELFLQAPLTYTAD